MEETALGSDEKYSCASASLADILSEGISCRIREARSPARREGESLEREGGREEEGGREGGKGRGGEGRGGEGGRIYLMDYQYC